MLLPGKRVKIDRWIHGRLCVVRLTVDAVIPDFEPREPCLEPQTIKFLDDIQRQADAGAVEALEEVGDVYVRKSA